MPRRLGHIAAFLLFFLGEIACAQTYWTSFEKGKEDAPDGWKLSDKFGKWEHEGRMGGRSVSVVGDGKRSSGWFCQPFPLDPNRAYRFSVWYRSEETRDNSQGVAVIATGSVEKIYRHSSDWTRVEFTFTTPTNIEGRSIRLGQWHFDGRIWYDDLTITPVNLTYFEKDGIVLGRDERIEKGTYIFQPDFIAPLTNCFRVEREHTRQFHNDKWWFRDGMYQIHRYQIGGHRQRSAEVGFRLTYKDKNIEDHEIKVEAGTDGKTWKEIKAYHDLGEYRMSIPSDLFPADAIFVRITGQGSMQMRQYTYSAKLDGSPEDMKGATEAFAGNYVVVDNGRLRLTFEEGSRWLVSIRRGGKQIGGIGCRIAQFEKKGIGYKGTGIGIAEATSVNVVQIKAREAQRCVIDVTTQRTESTEMARQFEAVYEFTVYAGQDGFASKLLSVKNTDKTAWELRGYFHLLQPRSMDDVKPLCFPVSSLSAWMEPGGFLGAVCQDEEDFTLGLRLVDKAAHGDVTRKAAAKLNAGQTWTGQEPEVIVFAADGSGPQEVVQKAREIRRVAGSPDQYVEGKMVVQERKQDAARSKTK